MDAKHQEVLRKLEMVNKSLQHTLARKLLRVIKEKELDNRFYVAIIGEFKRGKSSFVNALIGQDLLPTDVLPTTAVIHLLEYSEDECIEIVGIDGKVQKKPLTKHNLEQLTANYQEVANNIKYVKIKLNHPVLEQGLILIDTPGVNDICETRIEVTKDILPYADAIIFLLDAVAPLTRSEADFLTTQVLTYKLESMLFLLAKADRLDEDEDEREEALEGARERIATLIGEKNSVVIPYSAREVVGGTKEGIAYKEALQIELKRLEKHAAKGAHERQQQKINVARSLLLSTAYQKKQLLELKEEEYSKLQQHMAVKIEAYDLKFEMFVQNIEVVGRNTLKKMYKGSFINFLDKLTQDITDNLQLDPKVSRYWEKTMPIYIERQMRQYTEQTTHAIHMFLKKLNTHISKEYKKHFNLDIMIGIHEIGVQLPKFVAQRSMSSQPASEFLENMMPVTAGMIIGSLFMPGIGTILGSAAGQVIGANLRGQREEEMRLQLLGQLPAFLHTHLGCYEQMGEEAIDQASDKITSYLKQVHHKNKEETNRMMELVPIAEQEFHKERREQLEDIICLLESIQ